MGSSKKRDFGPPTPTETETVHLLGLSASLLAGEPDRILCIHWPSGKDLNTVL